MKAVNEINEQGVESNSLRYDCVGGVFAITVC